MTPAEWPLWVNILIFLIAAGAIGFAGTKMAGIADKLADRTGLGEALMGGLFLGASTSLPGITASVTAAIDGYAEMAVSNALGGIAAQTASLAIADIFHKRANLEHAAASVSNLVQTTLLIGLLAMLMAIMAGPDASITHIHPGTGILILAYSFGYVLIYRTRQEPMWKPTLTDETVEDEPDEDSKKTSLSRLWIGFGIAAVVVFVAGVAIARTGGAIVEETGISESIMGALFMAVSTSLPELITSIAAVKRGALTLAVGDIVGGNAFDMMFICMADMFFTGGSIYHAAGNRELFLVGVTILLNTLMLMGLLQRERKGFANIGFESALILLFYAVSIGLLWFAM